METDLDNEGGARARGGFTLIELLVVTVVIVTLMGVVFRLAGVGGGNRARAKTVQRLQRLENALSGYYAAYGSYPPVPLQGRSRSIYKKVDEYGRQEAGKDESGSKDFKSATMAVQIEAACRAQPLSVSWPAPNDGDVAETIEELSAAYKESGVGAPYNRSFSVLSGTGGLNLDAVDWRAQTSNGKDIQLFEFGLLSFLFPRYFFMLDGVSDEFFDHKVKNRLHSQWAANNQLPCRIDTGKQFKNWAEVRKLMGARNSSGAAENESSMISNLTSQAVCARWMPNFQGIVSTVSTAKYRYFFGVDVADTTQLGMAAPETYGSKFLKSSGGDNATLWKRRPRIFPKGGTTGSGESHMLLSMTVCDGWNREFYYSSDPPYQSYRLWSAGGNMLTFPPWYDLNSFSGDDLNQIHKFIEDDIVQLTSQ